MGHDGVTRAAAGTLAACSAGRLPAAGVTMRGREAEWGLVRESLQRAKGGTGGVLLIGGERGIGISLMLRESAREAAALGFSLAEAAGQEAGTRNIGQLRTVLEERAARSPVLVSLDDLHLESPATLKALRVLFRELERRQIVWLLARHETCLDREAGQLFGALADVGATHITLPPLSNEVVRGLLTEAFGAPPCGRLQDLASGAAGNPSLLTGLIHGLREDKGVEVVAGRARLVSADLPRGIWFLARQWFEGLCAKARHLLQVAAVMGRSFLLADISLMLRETPAALLPSVEEAVQAGILTADGMSFVFRHELVRHAITVEMPLSARGALHQQFGEILLRSGRSAVEAGEHFLAGVHASDPGTLAALDMAAARTLRDSPATAAELATRALEMTPPADPSVLSRTATAAETLTAAGCAGRAESIARETLTRPVPPILEARLRCVLSAVCGMTGRAQDARAEAQAALDQGGLPLALRDQAITACMQASVACGDDEAASRMADAVLGAAGYGAYATRAALVTRAVTGWNQGQVADGLERLREAARTSVAASVDARQSQPLLVLAAALVDLRLFGDCRALLRAARCELLRGIPAEAAPAILRARMYLAEGRLIDAELQGRDALATAMAAGARGYESVARCVLAVIAQRRGDLEAASRYIADGPLQAPGFAEIYALTESLTAAARIAEARDGAAATIDQIRGICAELSVRPGKLLGAPATAAWLVRTALAAGEDSLAAQAADAIDALAVANPGIGHITAAADHSMGLLRCAPALLGRAAAGYQDPWPVGSAAEDLGVLLASQGDTKRAVEQLRAAFGAYSQAGATPDVARLRRRLRELGVRRRHWSVTPGNALTGWDSLTRTERAVSQLVAQGLTNRQVGDRMYVSAHTVAFHLRKVFRKLNVSSRVQLVQVVLEQAQARPEEELR